MRNRTQTRLHTLARGTLAVYLFSFCSTLPLAGHAHVAQPATIRAKLKAAKFVDVDLVPFAAEFQIEGILPVRLVGTEVAVREGRKRLEIDVRRDGRYSARVRQNKPTVLEIKTEEGGRKVLVYWRRGQWYAASGACLVGKVLAQPILLLDGDLDGEFLGPSDYVRIGDGCPMVCDERKQIMIGETIYTMGIDSSSRRVGLTLEAMPRLAGASDKQWAALAAMNKFRRAIGLPPRTLNLERASACQLHAEYLYLNNYDYKKPWDGIGSHEEIVGNPGYTPEGREAARRSVTGGSGDPAERIRAMSRTMLHRIAFVGPVGDGIGVGAVDRSMNSGARGYCVIWCKSKNVALDQPPVTVPAPGQVGVETLGKRERPTPIEPVDFYKVPRGYPVSVSYGKRNFANVRLKLLVIDRKQEAAVKGHLFTPEKPIHPTRASNSSTAFFMPSEPLKPSTQYLAEFEADEDGKPIRLTWTFTTGEQ